MTNPHYQPNQAYEPEQQYTRHPIQFWKSSPPSEELVQIIIDQVKMERGYGLNQDYRAKE